MEVRVSPRTVTPVRLALDAPAAAAAAPALDRGRLRVQVSQPGAAMYLNGAFAGVAQGSRPALFTLPAGQHQIQIVLPGYKAYDATVAVPDRGEAVVAVELVRE